MKAIIMAGGEGTRLRPVSLNRPKPMTELFDRPVLEHILKLLRTNGVTEACLTLKYLPRMITDWFGGGDAKDFLAWLAPYAAQIRRRRRTICATWAPNRPR